MMTTRTHYRILKFLLFTVGFTMVVTWLPLVRVIFDGETYQWGTFWFGNLVNSAGLKGDWWFLLIQLAFGGSILYFGYRGPKKPFYWLLPTWFGIHFADNIYALMTRPEGLMFHGETLNIHFNVGHPLGVISGLLFALSLFWVIRDRREGNSYETPAWTKRNKILGIIAAVLFLPIIPLLAFGEPHALSDEIGVILTIIQWGLINAALYPKGHWGGKSKQK